MELDAQTLALFTEGYTKILEGIGRLGYNIQDENFAETAARAAKGLHELIHDQAQVQTEVSALLAKTFPAKYTEMVISKHNTAFGVCPHHLLPVIYRISMAYIPTNKVLGLSKLSRLARMIARGPRLQEDLPTSSPTSSTSSCRARARLYTSRACTCAWAARGVGAHEARLVTSGVRGIFLDHIATREEFIKLVVAPQTTVL